jgi:DNA (cytosine-5)-methyltransferase 1
MATVCSGIGAPEVAAALLGWDAVFMSEIEPFPAAVLAHHYPDVPNLGDMTAINGDEWRDKVDVIVGGTPCQAFSVAGKRQSLADERGNLTLKFVELCDAIRPAFVVWENVPGVFSTADNAFGCFLGALAGGNGQLVAPRGKWANAGYVLGSERAIAWRVLDAQYFGVAQRRRRVFLVACPRDGADPRKILFESEGVRRDFAPSREAKEDTAGTIEASLGRSRWAGTPISALTVPALTTSPYADNASREGCLVFDRQSSCEWGTENVAGSVCARDYKAPADLIAFHPTQDPIHSADGSCHALGCGSGGGCATHAVAFAQNQLGDVRVGDISGTLNTNNNPSGRNATMVAVGWSEELTAHIECGATLQRGGQGGRHDGVMTPDMQVRRLTPTECERLQGFPDGYTAIPWKLYQMCQKKGWSYEAELDKRGLRLKGCTVDDCPDGPRYKALGNSMAVPVVRWILRRIDATNNQVRM